MAFRFGLFFKLVKPILLDTLLLLIGNVLPMTHKLLIVTFFQVVHLRQRLDNAVSSSRDTTLTLDTALAMIQVLIDCDDFQDIATVQNLEDLLEHKTDLSDRLMQIGDSIVYKLVQWTKKLPFYLELPVEVSVTSLAKYLVFYWPFGLSVFVLKLFLAYWPINP